MTVWEQCHFTSCVTLFSCSVGRGSARTMSFCPTSGNLQATCSTAVSQLMVFTVLSSAVWTSADSDEACAHKLSFLDRPGHRCVRLYNIHLVIKIFSVSRPALVSTQRGAQSSFPPVSVPMTNTALVTLVFGNKGCQCVPNFPNLCLKSHFPE